ncbi:hypothetical protein HY524_00020 [Candidatus Berkelbacteria bacterium]|nr:hypothetical protein [Candidatus Berkelbacteria bacterium]
MRRFLVVFLVLLGIASLSFNVWFGSQFLAAKRATAQTAPAALVGTVKTVSGTALVVRDREGKDHRLGLSADTTIRYVPSNLPNLPGVMLPTTQSVLTPDQSITVTPSTDGKRATTVAITTDRLVLGEVKTISADQLTLARVTKPTGPDDDTVTVMLNPDTVVTVLHPTGRQDPATITDIKTKEGILALVPVFDQPATVLAIIAASIKQ